MAHHHISCQWILCDRKNFNGMIRRWSDLLVKWFTDLMNERMNGSTSRWLSGVDGSRLLQVSEQCHLTDTSLLHQTTPPRNHVHLYPSPRLQTPVHTDRIQYSSTVHLWNLCRLYSQDTAIQHYMEIKSQTKHFKWLHMFHGRCSCGSISMKWFNLTLNHNFKWLSQTDIVNVYRQK